MPTNKAKNAAPEFAARLTQAVADRGLPLSRIQKELQSRGLTVSVATLSYWGSGRSAPVRASSRPVVEALEEILKVPRGRLTHALDHAQNARVGLTGERQARIQELIASTERPSTDGQDMLMVHNEAVIRADRSQAEAITTQVIHARERTLTGWSMTVETEPGLAPEPVAMRGLEITRCTRLDDRATLVEFRHDPPVPVGDTRRTQHKMVFHAHDVPETVHGYAPSKPLGLLILTVTFEGELPRRIWRSFAPSGPGAEMKMKEGLIPAPVVEVALASPALGLHVIQWEW